MVSVVVPCFNEAASLPELHRRLTAVLAGTPGGYELLFVDDGSRDATAAVIRELAGRDPRTRGIILARNFGQHAAVRCGFAQAAGDVIVTLDADLQNPPEEIPKLLARLAEGYDAVAGVRQHRQDSFLRRLPTRFIRALIGWCTGVRLTDFGCMLRAYRRAAVARLLACPERITYITALTSWAIPNTAEVAVEHHARAHGASRYRLGQLVQLTFNIVTGFTLLPLQLITLLGVLVLGAGLVIAAAQLLVLPGYDPAAALVALVFFFAGIQFIILGIMGEYLGRIYREVQQRPPVFIADRIGFPS